MSGYSQHINIRLTPGEKSRVLDVAAGNDLSVSQLVRALIQLPRECIDGDATHTVVVVDRNSVPRLEREMRRWGNHYNQAVHALNRIAYYAERGSLKTEEAHRLLRKAEGNLEDLNVAVTELRGGIEGLARRVVVRL